MKLNSQAFNGLRIALGVERSLREFRDAAKSSRFSPLLEAAPYYFLFKNFCHDLSEPALGELADMAHDLYSKILDVPLDQHPVFGIGTPETMSKSSPDEVNDFIGDLLNTPSSYYFVARKGNISVVPVTEHGSFMASHATTRGKSASSGLCAVVTSALSAEIHHAPPGLSDLRALINGNNTKEQDLQRLL